MVHISAEQNFLLKFLGSCGTIKIQKRTEAPSPQRPRQVRGIDKGMGCEAPR